MSSRRAEPAEGRKAYETLNAHDGISLGIYRCRHHNVDRGPEQFARNHTINVPTRGLYVKHGRFGASLVDTQRAVFFSATETYRTSHPCGCGDAGFYFVLAPEHVRAVVSDLDPALAAGDADAFPFSDGPLPRSATLGVERLARDATSDTSDGFAFEERALGLARAILEPAYRVRRSRPNSRTNAPCASHREIAERAAAVLAANPDPTYSLSRLARDVGASPFHVSRVFHAVRGMTLREYRDRIRLHAALDRVLDGERDLTRLAHELGFSSHSHFTYRFRRLFGISPSSARKEFTSTRARP